MNSRLNIESTLLSAIIYDNRLASVIHILSPENFSSMPTCRNREIYEILCKMFPAQPVDPLSVFNLLVGSRSDQNEIMASFYKIPPVVTSSENLIYWAFILLQIDITEKFKKQCIRWKDDRRTNFDHVPAAVLTEVIENLEANVDIFLLIEKATLYFHQQKMEIEYEESVNFYQNISKRVSNLKNMNSINTALRYLLQLCQGSSEVQHHCNTMANAIADMIISNNIKEKYKEAVNIINQ